MTMNPVVHFQMPGEDKARMGEFYTKVFGWKTIQLGPEMGNYMIVHTTETDQQGMVQTPGAINGGFSQKTADNQVPNVVIAVSDISEAMKQVAAFGGTVLGGQKPGEPDDIPGVGLYCSFIDTEGNRVGMMQPVKK